MAVISLPQLGESIVEGTISRLLKKVGDVVAVDEPLFEVSTDKVDTEVPSPVAGVVVAWLVNEGDTIDVGAAVVEIGEGAAAPAPAPAPAPAVVTPGPAPAPVAAPAPAPAPAPVPAPAPAPAPAPVPVPASAAPAAPAPANVSGVVAAALPAFKKTPGPVAKTPDQSRTFDSSVRHTVRFTVESPKLSTDVLGHLAFAALRAAEVAKWGEVTLSAGVHHAGRSLFANVFDAQALRKEALSKRISELASRAAALTPADLMPAW